VCQYPSAFSRIFVNSQAANYGRLGGATIAVRGIIYLSVVMLRLSIFGL
jgi:hypothetical protein